MDETTAWDRLSSMVAKVSDPVLDDLEVSDLLSFARRPDSDGLLPDDANWTGTYDLNAAAAEGWRWKAAKAAGQFAFSSDGQTFNRNQIYEACLAMADRYSKRVVGSIPYNLPTTWDSDIAGNTNV